MVLTGLPSAPVRASRSCCWEAAGWRLGCTAWQGPALSGPLGRLSAHQTASASAICSFLVGSSRWDMHSPPMRLVRPGHLQGALACPAHAVHTGLQRVHAPVGAPAALGSAAKCACRSLGACRHLTLAWRRSHPSHVAGAPTRRQPQVQQQSCRDPRSCPALPGRPWRGAAGCWRRCRSCRGSRRRPTRAACRRQAPVQLEAPLMPWTAG